MNSRLLTLTAAAMLISGAAFADHNSKWGEGWAKMPNDIHNTRIETRGSNTSFRDFVQYGDGATSDNRFPTSESNVRSRQASYPQGRRSSTGQSQSRRGR
jgi:hypothetical protein